MATRATLTRLGSYSYVLYHGAKGRERSPLPRVVQKGGSGPDVPAASACEASWRERSLTGREALAQVRLAQALLNSTIIYIECLFS